MAGDWIKMRFDLQTHPKVVRIMSATSSNKFAVIGGLHAIWCIFDAHSDDGLMQGYTHQILDQMIGWEGFCRAVIDVGWLIEGCDNSLQLPDFTEHNGESAKKRADDSKRKRRTRAASKTSDECPKNSGQKAGLEKRREDNKNNKKSDASNFDAFDVDADADAASKSDAKFDAIDFDAFWDIYPRKVSKSKTEKLWSKLKVKPELFAKIKNNIEARITCGDWSYERKEFIPHPDTYLRNERWDDELVTHQTTPPRQPNGSHQSSLGDIVWT